MSGSATNLLEDLLHFTEVGVEGAPAESVDVKKVRVVMMKALQFTTVGEI